jgi:hypothetical protein
MASAGACHQSISSGIPTYRFSVSALSRCLRRSTGLGLLWRRAAPPCGFATWGSTSTPIRRCGERYPCHASASTSPLYAAHHVTCFTCGACADSSRSLVLYLLSSARTRNKPQRYRPHLSPLRKLPVHDSLVFSPARSGARAVSR